MLVSSVVADLLVMSFGLVYRRSVTCSFLVPSDLAVLTSMLTIRLALRDPFGCRICGIFVDPYRLCAVVPTCVWLLVTACVWLLGVWWLPKGFR